MPKKLLIHLGPPKTATTSLQHWIYDNQNSYTYLGINQPRRPKDNIVYNKFWLFLNNKMTCKELIEFLENIKTKQVLIFSEEMILTDNWKNKLNRLAELKNHFDLHLAYCYRPTTKALPSYYAEIHSELPLAMKNSYELFLKDDRVGAYDLEKILDAITEKKLSLNIFKFEELIKNTLTLNSVFNTSFKGFDFNKNIEISKENSRKNKSGNIYEVIDKKPKYPTKLKSLLIKIEKKFNISFKGVFQKNYYIKIDSSVKVDELSKKNKIFFKKYIDE
ncbi:hypothetical protein [Flavobacterium sp. CS20]|uniref:hypothetical protein n=1 Tax=Flavobacterium sp. CS20 TaxID=2775246 RepID=UPI001B3A3386|nr:hypothetical protein [Flavobacterium sp. CS20]QTY27703.1 hypothetical protein IGB25_04005 [Flavobacterium sp. CS20]